MTTIFTRIVNGEIPADKVLEDDDHLAFLDIVPVQPGHVLCIPKHEVGYLFDMAPEAQAKLWDFVRRVEAVHRASRVPSSRTADDRVPSRRTASSQGPLGWGWTTRRSTRWMWDLPS